MTALTEEVPSRRSRRLIVVGAVVAIGAIAVAATQLGGGSPNPQAAARSATTVSGGATAVAGAAPAVAGVTADGAETTPVNGTVGFASPSSVVEPAGLEASSLTKDQEAGA